MHESQHGIQQIHECLQLEQQSNNHKQQVKQQTEKMPIGQGNIHQHMSFLQQGN